MPQIVKTAYYLTSGGGGYGRYLSVDHLRKVHKFNSKAEYMSFLDRSVVIIWSAYEHNSPIQMTRLKFQFLTSFIKSIINLYE